MPGQSVGAVQPQRAHFDQPLHLRSGGVLPAYDLVYETYGTLNAAKSNAILVCHALSGHHHIAGHYADQPDNIGWWDNIVGPGRPLDTDKFFIVGLNNLGEKKEKQNKWGRGEDRKKREKQEKRTCLLYTSDAADDMQCVDLGGRRIIKKKKTKQDN
eukprot:TRINITY_DN3383_c0_g1_i5.p2 TRINITY_DN3383_c0_g1~~TRINITY_DN3383_c0_g1_i5.p2  ORF type:complete len:157 (-),score=43.07 TRINITY_DN3383_c0_g1_i5:97-567(-)